MKRILTTILLLAFFASTNAQTKLITIYDENCEYCQDLLQKTYTDKAVIAKLNDYDRKTYEINSDEAKRYAIDLGITGVPAQIFISKTDTVVINGFQEMKAQLEILKNPFSYSELNPNHNEFGIMEGKGISVVNDKDDLVITKLDMLRICSKMLSAKNSRGSSYEAFLKFFEELLEKKNYTDYKNIEKLAADNLEKLKCKNRSGTKMREYSSLFKYAIDSRDYSFVQGALFVKKGATSICNENIKCFLTKAELVDGKRETLVQFIDKLLARDEMSSFYNFEVIKSIKNKIQACIEYAEFNK